MGVNRVVKRTQPTIVKDIHLFAEHLLVFGTIKKIFRKVDGCYPFISSSLFYRLLDLVVVSEGERMRI